MTNICVSRVLIFVSEPDLQPTVELLAQAADTEPTCTDMLRRDGSTSQQGSVTVGGTVIEVSGGEVAAPAVLELSVPDPEAAAQRAAEASGFEAKSTMRGWAVKAPGLMIALRSA